MRLTSLSLLACVGLAACAPRVEVLDIQQVPQLERREAAAVRIYKLGDTPPTKTTYIGPVEATSCKHWTWEPPASQANATEQLKVKAYRMGATAVTDYSCDKSGTDVWGTNCWQSVTCNGNAMAMPAQSHGN